MTQNIGKITQIIGPVVDVTFDRQGSEMPDIYDALEIKREDGSVLVLECQQHIGILSGPLQWIQLTGFGGV